MAAINRYLRFEAGFTPRVREVAILTTAREMDSQFEWVAHEPEALKEGVGQDVIDATHTTHEFQVYPDLNLVKLGGLSIIDRGRAAVFPLITEIIEARQQHQLMIGVGGGTRERHTYAIGLDLGLPTGGLAMIAGAIPEQNGTLIQTTITVATK